MTGSWPEDVKRIPDDAWTRLPIDDLATNYDTVETHGWYTNLLPTIDELCAAIHPGDLYVDYSGGTGILIGRLLEALEGRPFGIINVDSSPKFLRLSLEKFRDDPRVAFRLIRHLDPPGRLQWLDEVLEASLVRRGIDGVVSTNAVHLYHDLAGTVASWARCLRPGGRVFIQSGNIDRPHRPAGFWIIDDTVHAIAEAAESIVRSGSPGRWSDHAQALDDGPRMARYRELRERYFLPVRDVSSYVEVLERNGLMIESVVHRPIHAKRREWVGFLEVYHEGILPWIGGTRRIDGQAPTDEAVADRIALLRTAAERVLPEERFQAEWTYLTAVKV